MSYVLLSQNLEILREGNNGGGGGYPPPDPPIIEAENLYTGTVPLNTNVEILKSLICCGLNNDKIVITPEGAKYVEVSLDAGQTWQKRDLPREALIDNNHTMISYDELGDTWWSVIYQNSIRQPYYYYTEDDYASFTQFDDGGTEQQYCFGGEWNKEDGNFWAGGRAGNAIAIHKYVDPKSTDAKTTLRTTLVPTATPNPHRYMAGPDYLVSIGLTSAGHGGALHNLANDTRLGNASNWCNGSRHQVMSPNGLWARPSSTNNQELVIQYIDGPNPPAVLNSITRPSDVPLIQKFAAYGEGSFVMGALWDATLQRDKLKLAYCFEDDLVQNIWSPVFTVLLTDYLDQNLSNQFVQLEYFGQNRWLFGYFNQNDNFFKLDMFTLDVKGVSLPGRRQGDLARTILSQQALIFYQMDDSDAGGAVTELVDIGIGNYSNSVFPSGMTYGEQGLVTDDGGTAVLVTADIDAGAITQKIPAPSDHAFLFILKHDGAAQDRVLASFGDVGTTGMSIVLAADNTIQVNLWDGENLNVYATTATVATDVPVMCAVSLSEECAEVGRIDIYIDTQRELRDDGAIWAYDPTGIIGVMGGYNTDSMNLEDSANGVTIDYWALIPHKWFNYADLADAWGIQYAPPPAPAADPTKVEFLIHAEDSVLTGPNPSARVLEQQFWNAVNSVVGPKLVNRVSTEDPDNRLNTSEFKFGTSCLYVPRRASTYQDPYRPFDNMYWPITNASPSQMGFPALTLGKKAFSYDLWVKQTGDAPVIACSSKFIYRHENQWKTFGGIEMYVGPEPGNPGFGWCKIYVGNKKQTFGKTWSKFKIEYRMIPGYLLGDWNHVALCRQRGDCPDWHAFINGRTSQPRVTVYVTGEDYIETFVEAGEAWMIGSAIKANFDDYGRYQMEMYFDEACLRVGEAIFTEEFEPPTAPYDYG